MLANKSNNFSGPRVAIALSSIGTWVMVSTAGTIGGWGVFPSATWSLPSESAGLDIGCVTLKEADLLCRFVTD